jgi:hypothetical protein
MNKLTLVVSEAVMKTMMIPLDLEQDAVFKRGSDGKVWLQWEQNEIIECDGDKVEHLPAKTIRSSITEREAEELLTYSRCPQALNATTFSSPA